MNKPNKDLKDSAAPWTIHYKLKFEEGVESDFLIKLENKTLDLVQSQKRRILNGQNWNAKNVKTVP